MSSTGALPLGDLGEEGGRIRHEYAFDSITGFNVTCVSSAFRAAGQLFDVVHCTSKEVLHAKGTAVL
jgi:hypothetical protein